MSLSAGIIGLPNVGKSTIFNALCSQNAGAENFPFCTVNPNTGIAEIIENRLDEIVKIIETDKVVPPFLEIVDIAGLVKGASKGEGLGNQFLSHIKNVDAVIHIVRCFKDADIVNTEADIDPVRDVEIVETELILKDLETVERARQKSEKLFKKGDKNSKPMFDILNKIYDNLSEGICLRSISLTDEESKLLEGLHLITDKKVLYVANIGEDDIGTDSKYASNLREYALCHNSGFIKLCGRIEAEIKELEKEEQKDFLESMGLNESALNDLAKQIYSLLGLQTFFTARKSESRAWNLLKGSTAYDAAGKIHTDFQKGFVCAEVFRLEDLKETGTLQELRNRGKIRTEGKDYIVKEGDIINFKSGL